MKELPDLKTSSVVGWALVLLGTLSPIAKMLGHPELSHLLDEFIGSLEPLLPIAGAGVLHLSEPPILPRIN